MKLWIVDKDTRIILDIIKTFTFVQYTEEFVGEGNFTINLPLSEESIKYMSYGNFIVFDEGIVGIIKSRKDSEDDGNATIITGKLTNHILSYRSILTQFKKTGSLSAIARELVDMNFIHTKDSKRKIDFIKLSEDKNYNPTSESITYSNTGDTIRESISDLFLPFSYGFKLYPIVRSIQNENDKNIPYMEFRVIKPVDRTINNKDDNEPVVFSFDFGNVTRLEFEEEGNDYSSIAIVASEDSGDNRKLLEVGEDKSGYDRVELYVDARDIQSEKYNEETMEIEKIPESELKEMMKQRGLEKLESHKLYISFQASVLAGKDSKYEYGVDFELGDFVSVIDKYRNLSYNLQVSSITKSISNGSEYFDMQLGLDKLAVNSISTSKQISGSNSGQNAVSALNGFSFGYTDDGKPGYRIEGADSVIPFKSGGSNLSSMFFEVIGFNTIVESNFTFNLFNENIPTKFIYYYIEMVNRVKFEYGEKTLVTVSVKE